MKTHVISIAVLLTLMPSAARAQGGDAVKGLAVAQAQCAQCHAIHKGAAPSPNVRAPTFAAIAAVPGMTAIALNAFLLTSHATMPNIILTADDRRDLVAYIVSLRAD